MRSPHSPLLQAGHDSVGPDGAMPRAELGLGTALQLLPTDSHGPELIQVYLAAAWVWDPW